MGRWWPLDQLYRHQLQGLARQANEPAAILLVSASFILPFSFLNHAQNEI